MGALSCNAEWCMWNTQSRQALLLLSYNLEDCLGRRGPALKGGFGPLQTILNSRFTKLLDLSRLGSKVRRLRGPIREHDLTPLLRRAVKTCSGLDQGVLLGFTVKLLWNSNFVTARPRFRPDFDWPLAHARTCFDCHYPLRRIFASLRFAVFLLFPNISQVL